jgi:hypothetical protein
MSAQLSFLKPSDRFKLLQADLKESFKTLDESHLFSQSKPIDPRHFGNIPADMRQRIHNRLLEREAWLESIGMETVFDDDLNAFVVRSKPKNRTVLHSVESDRFTEGEFDLQAENSATAPEGDRGAIFRFMGKKAALVAGQFLQNEKNISFLGLNRNTPRKPKSLGSCNTQTNAGVPARIAINRGDFLAR